MHRQRRVSTTKWSKRPKWEAIKAHIKAGLKRILLTTSDFKNLTWAKIAEDLETDVGQDLNEFKGFIEKETLSIFAMLNKELAQEND